MLNTKNHLHNPENPEWGIRLQASKMLSSFYHKTLGPPSKNRKWKAGYKESLRRLKIKCADYGIRPLPIELQELEGYLSGKKKNIIQVEKMFVASCMAEGFGIEDIDKHLSSMIDLGTNALDEIDGIRNSKLQKSKEHDRRKTIRTWLADKDFLAELAKKRTRVLKGIKRHGTTNLVISKKIFEKK